MRVAFSDLHRCVFLAAFLFFHYLSLQCECMGNEGRQRPNVLLIAVDDLRPELGCYGESHVQSPNIDSLAASGRLFERAYCQQAVCNPSRTSLMTGLRPDTIGVTGNHVHFRSKRPNVITLSQYFMRYGYHAQSIGKIYHGVFPEGSSKTVWDTMGDPQSWSIPTSRFGPRYYYTETGIEQAKQAFLSMYRPQSPMPDDWTKKLVFGPMTEAPDVDDDILFDGKVAAKAVKTLRELKQTGKPFFLAIGFIKPHSPFVAPKKYWDLYDAERIELAERMELPEDAPAFAGHASAEIRRYTDQPNRGDIPDSNARQMKHGYFACISYIDAQIGKVLAVLEEQELAGNTIVVLFGDHGYHLGEHGLWGKTTNFELDTRVPLIIRTPNMTSAGESTKSLAELVDLYPTLTELAGLPIPDHLEGTSLVPSIDSPKLVMQNCAISQFPRGGNANTGGKIMGYSLRTNRWRYTEWIDQQSGNAVARELYAHQKNDSVESKNLAGLDENSRLVSQLSAQLRQNIAQPDDSIAESFEEVDAGRFIKLESEAGTWTAAEGHAEIDNKHANSGTQCLHLLGGEKRTVELELKAPMTASLSFQAERWTRRDPFSFRIEQSIGDGQWKELFNGDKLIKIGHFSTKVSVPIAENVTRLRFSCTSPANSGILIDDISIVPPTKQKIDSVTVDKVHVPVLTGLDRNPLLRIRVDTTGSLEPISMEAMRVNLAGTITDGDLQLVQMFSTSERETFHDTAQPFGKSAVGKPGDHDFSGDHELVHGSNFFWLSCKLQNDANIDHMIDAHCTSIAFSNGKTFDPKTLSANTNTARGHRLGVAVRQQNQDKVHTCRIPGLATTNAGTLIGVYDMRHRGRGDLPGDIDVGMSRSTDGGRTWEPMRAIMDMGDDPDWNYDGVGDPAILVDKGTGTIWVAGTWSHGNRSWVGSGPGLNPEETGQLMLVRSDDDGISWSKPINITAQVKKPEWCFLLQGPGKGITMRNGTIVFAAQYQDPIEQKRLPHSTIIYSSDHGKTWQCGTGAFDDTTEAQVIETQPGTLMLNCRYNRKGVRVVMTTRDMGRTWQKHPTSERALIEPGACMASLINVDAETGQDLDGWLLFSNPDSVRGRNRITIKASEDGGTSWPREFRLLLDEGDCSGYSCMSMVDAETIGILYEGSRAQMTFQRIPLKDVTTRLATLRGNSLNGSSPSDKSNALKLPPVFSHHMVLQANAKIPVWGTAKPKSSVNLKLGEESRETIADANGRWQVEFSARNASYNPTNLAVLSGETELVLEDILIGEVWLCAGQSNMEWTLQKTTHGANEISHANRPAIRLLNLAGGASGSSGSYQKQHLSRLQPELFCKGRWQVASPDSASNFSAVAWHFGETLQSELDVPVGLICPAVGGTPTESWIPRDALKSDPDLRKMVAGNWLDNEVLGDFCRERGESNLLAAIQSGESIPGDALGPNHSFKPGFMWQAGIEPLIPFAIAGAIWYQGESNAETAERVIQHDRLFPLLVQQWRVQWRRPDLPFLFVQLPAIERPNWPTFRDQQRRFLEEIANTGMAVTIDTGHPTNVHPPLKKPVGERLARWALGTTYKKDSASVYSGPLFHSVAQDDGSLIVSFDHVGTGLGTSDGKEPRHFEIAGNDHVFHPAAARILDANKVSVTSLHVTDPKHVRYAWFAFAQPGINLVNSENLPASPFTSESRKELSELALDEAALNNKRPNILLIIGEDHGCELSCYGDPVIETPNIDRLAYQGILFENGYVTQSVCSPSRSTIFTGLYPHQNGQLGLATHQFACFRKWPTTYSILKQAGFRTGLIGKTHINPAEIVEDFVDFRYQVKSNFAKKDLANYAIQAGRFFQESDEPFFMTVNYPDAHWPLQDRASELPTTPVDEDKVRLMPYVGDETPRLRKIAENYYNCMLRLDECVGQLLKQLEDSGKSENTLVVFIGDHGAQMARGKVTVYEGGLRIPFIARWPQKINPHQRSAALVSTIDLLPTFADMTDSNAPENLPGKSLLSLFGEKEGTAQLFREYLCCERNCDAAHITFPQRTIRDGQYKLIYSPIRDREDPAARYYRIHGASHWAGSLSDDELAKASEQTRMGYQRWLNPPEYQLYDLKNDPHEWNDLALEPRYEKTKTRLRSALQQWQRTTNDPFRNLQKLTQLMQETSAINAENRRSPKDGWQYLQYLYDEQE